MTLLSSAQRSGFILIVFIVLGTTCTRDTKTTSVEKPAVVRLYPETKNITPGQPLRIAIEISLGNEWHTYWYNPGDAGLAPNISWRLPEGWRHAEVELPIPERFESMGVVSFGFAHTPVFFATLFPPPLITDDTVSLDLSLRLLLCKEECIPFTDSFRISLPVGAERVMDDTAKEIFLTKTHLLPRADTIKGTWTYAENDQVALTFAMDGSFTTATDLVFFPVNKGFFDYQGKQTVKFHSSTTTVSLPLAKIREEQPEVILGVLTSENRQKNGLATAVVIHAKKEEPQ